MRKIIVPSIICIAFMVISINTNAQTNPDTSKVKSNKKEFHHSKDSTNQQKITVNEDGVKAKRKFKKAKNKNTQEEKLNPEVKKEE